MSFTDEYKWMFEQVLRKPRGGFCVDIGGSEETMKVLSTTYDWDYVYSPVCPPSLVSLLQERNNSNTIYMMALTCGERSYDLLDEFVRKEWVEKYRREIKIVPKTITALVVQNSSETTDLLLRKLLKSWYIDYVKTANGYDYFIEMNHKCFA
jgi:hypothetical protein